MDTSLPRKLLRLGYKTILDKILIDKSISPCFKSSSVLLLTLMFLIVLIKKHVV